MGDLNFCPSCGNKLEPGTKVCPNCGINLSQQQSASSGGFSFSKFSKGFSSFVNKVKESELYEKTAKVVGDVTNTVVDSVKESVKENIDSINNTTNTPTPPAPPTPPVPPTPSAPPTPPAPPVSPTTPVPPVPPTPASQSVPPPVSEAPAPASAETEETSNSTLSVQGINGSIREKKEASRKSVKALGRRFAGTEEKLITKLNATYGDGLMATDITLHFTTHAIEIYELSGFFSKEYKQTYNIPLDKISEVYRKSNLSGNYIYYISTPG